MLNWYTNALERTRTSDAHGFNVALYPTELPKRYSGLGVFNPLSRCALPRLYFLVITYRV